MNVKFAVIVLVWLPTASIAQGFAGLGTTAQGFAVPQPDYSFTFPADHGAHPEFRIEWWYLTANLTGPDGTDYGLQWTLFRSALRTGDGEGWHNPQLWMGHAAVTTPETHYVSERLARGGTGQAGVTTQPFSAWIDEWSMSGAPDLTDLNLRATGADFGFDMALTAKGPLIFHGDGGYSVKSAAGQASYYYSQPFYDISGALTLPEGQVDVSGKAWLDREWSSQPLSETQNGWDWFSLGFDDGARLMGFQLRHLNGEVFSSATWIGSDGTTTAYPDGAFRAEPLASTSVADVRVPTQWHVTLQDRGVDITVSALNDSAWMATSIPYWEGPVRIKGTHVGQGYLEMTGYQPD